MVKQGDLGEAEYEAFTPGAYYYPAEMDMPAPQDGTYYVAVFDEELAGPFGLAVGYEEKWTLPGGSVSPPTCCRSMRGIEVGRSLSRPASRCLS